MTIDTANIHLAQRGNAFYIGGLKVAEWGEKPNWVRTMDKHTYAKDSNPQEAAREYAIGIWLKMIAKVEESKYLSV